ncbi:MAG TPA: hypothetical protein VJI98_04470 [Candidatus Nanoarchaeia archaeon]|nr:hypothetical protein [Candidatus Nanoarchaeia archaeon]
MSKEKAWEQHDVANYLLNTTYPAIGDPKLLLTILHNIHASLNAAMDAIIGKNSLTFKQKTIKTQTKGFNTLFIQDINGLIELHQKSPIEFSKEGRYVICNEDYRLKFVTTQTIQELLTKTKLFLEKM